MIFSPCQGSSLYVPSFQKPVTVLPARSFDGSSTLVKTPAASLSGTKKASVAFSAYVSSWVVDARLVCYGGSIFDASGGLYAFYDGNGGRGIHIGTRDAGGFATRYTTSVPSTGAWHHYVITVDRSLSGSAKIVALYVDGTAQSLTNNDAAGNTNNFMSSLFTLFGEPDNGTNRSAGRISRFAAWGGVVLSAGEALSLAQGAPPSYVQGASLLGDWLLDAQGLDRSGQLTALVYTGSPASVRGPLRRRFA